jgi:serine/threonine protein kinase
VIQSGKEIGGLRAGQYIAVKKFRIRTDEPDTRQFTDELVNLKKLQHQNIVRLIGYSYEVKQVVVDYIGRSVLADYIKRAICLEYLHNGSLDKHISGRIVLYF